MILHVTKKLAEKLKISPASQPVEDEFLSWRANYIRESGLCLVVFMNDASRFTVVINDAKAAKLKKIDELFMHELRETLLAHNVNPEVIDCYLEDLGEITYSKNTDRNKTAQLTRNIEFLGRGLRRWGDNFDMPIFANKAVFSTPGNGEPVFPNSKMLEMLGRYGKPVRKFRAFDLNARLSLKGKDAIRKLRVSANTSFEQLHRVLQAAFNWSDYHLYSFELFREWSDDYFAKPDVELVREADLDDAFDINPDAISMKSVKLSVYLPEYRKIMYNYDFGDDWRVYIEVENVIEDCREEPPIMLSGEGDAPPEDVGGPYGFKEFLEIMANPKHKEHEKTKDWAHSQRWQPFDFETAAWQVRTMF